MYKNRLEEIKEIHEKANEAYSSYESTSACADQDAITDNLHTLFYEEHTDWLIEQAEKAERYEKALEEINQTAVYYDIKGWALNPEKIGSIASKALDN